MSRPFPQGKGDGLPDVPVLSKRRRFHALISAHLVLSDHPHATAAAPVGGLEDDGEAVGLCKHLRLLQAGDGGIRSRNHGNTCNKSVQSEKDFSFSRVKKNKIPQLCVLLTASQGQIWFYSTKGK